MTVEEMFAQRRALMEQAAQAGQAAAAAQTAAASDDDTANADAAEEAAADAAANDGDAAAAAASPKAVAPSTIGDNAHKYVGTDDRGDVYQLYDAANNRVLEWAVPVNADSRAIIPGTLRDLGKPSSMTVAQGPTPPAAPPAATNPTQNPGEEIAIGNRTATSNEVTLVPVTTANNQQLATVPGQGIPAVQSPTGVPGAVTVVNYQVATDATSPAATTATATTATAQPTTRTTTSAAEQIVEADTEPDQGEIMNEDFPPVQGDPAHKYVGQDERGQVWQTYDGAQNRVLEWAVAPGSDSRNIIGGSLRDLGAPSAMTIAQAPAGSTLNAPTSTAIPTTTNRDTSAPAQATTLPTSAPAAAVSRIVGDARHKYVGTDNRGDVYQLYDPAGDRVLEWAVAVNDDSRNVISGSLRDLGAPSSMTTAQRSDYTAPTTNNSNPSNAPGNATPGAVQTNQNTQTTAGAGQPRQSDARHKYVGRLPGGNDVWQLFDGVNVIEWQVKGGDESGNIISGTARNLGAPSSMTVAQNDGTKPGGPQSTTSQTISSSANQGAAGSSAAATAPGEKSAVLVWAGIAASLLSALK